MKKEVIHNEKGRSCNGCNTFKSWESFYRDKKGLNGRKSKCKECTKGKSKTIPEMMYQDIGHREFSEHLKDTEVMLETRCEEENKRNNSSCLVIIAMISVLFTLLIMGFFR